MKKIVCILLSLLHLFFIVGCTHTVTKYRDDYVPEQQEVKVSYKDPKLIPRYKTIPPIFPLNKKPMLLAVLPFTSSTSMPEHGVEIAEEIEFAMLKHPRATENRYRLLNRSQLENVLKEKKIQYNENSYSELRTLLNVDGLITGHVKIKALGMVSFIIKAVDTRDASILFSERFEGPENVAVNQAVNVFYDQQVIDKIDTTFVTKYKYETQTQNVKKKVPYYAEELDPLKTFFGLCAIIIGGILLFSTSQNPPISGL